MESVPEPAAVLPMEVAFAALAVAPRPMAEAFAAEAVALVPKAAALALLATEF